MMRKMTPEQFWKILWGEEAFLFASWNGEEWCPLAHIRFREALDRMNDFLKEMPRKRREKPSRLSGITRKVNETFDKAEGANPRHGGGSTWL
jgi:hypothetical protein